MNKKDLTLCIITVENAAEYREARKALATVHETATSIINDSIAASETPAQTVDTLVKTLGFETALETVAELVNMVGDWDGRIYDATRRWAASVPGALDKPALDKVRLYQKLHSVHVNQLAQAMREAQNAYQEAQEAQEAQEKAQPEEKPSKAQKPAQAGQIYTRPRNRPRIENKRPQKARKARAV